MLLGSIILRELLHGLDRTDRRRMVMLAALSIGLTVFVAPRTNRIYYDEHIYQSVGQNLTDLRLAQVCNDGNVEFGRLQCGSGEYNKQPYAYPHLLSVAYRLFGVHPATAFVVNAAVMGLTVCCLYLLVFSLFRSRDAAFFAALLMALTPEQLLWSATAAVEPSASLASVAALLCAVHASRSTSIVTMAGAFVAIAYAVQFRPESFLIAPVAGLLMWPRISRELTRPRLWWLALLCLVLVGVPIGHMFSVRNVEWGTTEARMSLRYVVDNLRVNGVFYFADSRFPPFFTLLAADRIAWEDVQNRTREHGVVFFSVLRDLSFVLCRQLQLRSRCSVLRDDVPCDCRSWRRGRGSVGQNGSKCCCRIWRRDKR